jgi:hypothetical protein
MAASKSITIDGVTLTLHGNDAQTLAITGNEEMSLKTLLKLVEIALTNTPLKGSEADGLDPRYQFVSVARHLNRVPIPDSSEMRFSTVRFLSMFQQDSTPPIAR